MPTRSRFGLREVHLLLRDELTAYPGRLVGSLRDTLGIVLAVVLAETLRVPGISLAVALLFLVQRERPGLTLQTALQVLGGAVCACAATLFWVQLTDGTAALRLMGLIVGIFTSAFCMGASRFPLFWTIFAFYGVVDLSAWETHRGVNAIVTSSLNNLAALALTMACASGITYVFASNDPGQELDKELHIRLQVLQAFYAALEQGAAKVVRRKRQQLILLVQGGDLRLHELYDQLQTLGGMSNVPIGLQFRIGLLSRVLAQSILVGTHGDQLDSVLAAVYRQMRQLCGSDDKQETEPTDGTSQYEQWPSRLRTIATELRQYQQSYTGVAQPVYAQTESRPSAGSTPIFNRDAFRSRSAVMYALKLTLAATVCYVLYNAVAWPGILTCVVTVLFTGLSSTGAMKQKQFYRFAGAGIGGLLGLGTVSILFPNMDSITSLVLVLGAVAMLSGWILRSPHISYVGVQIAFAFSLVALPGFSAATQLAPARDRMVGISVGIIVMWLVFDQLWPVSTVDELQRILKVIQDGSTRLHTFDSDLPEVFASEREQLRMQISGELVLLQQLEIAAHYDFGSKHKRTLVHTRRVIREIDHAASVFYAKVLEGPS